MKYCEKCGTQLEDDVQFCPNCGNNTKKDGFSDNLSSDLKNIVSTNSANVSPKSRLIAAILAWFFGIFGIHRIYVGKVASGVLMLVFFWAIIPWIIGFVDFILILCGSFKDSEGRDIVKW